MTDTMTEKMTGKEVASFAKRVRQWKNMKKNQKAGFILLWILFLFLTFLAFVMLVTDGYIVTQEEALFGGVLLLAVWIAASCGCVRLLKCLMYRPVRRLLYKKKVFYVARELEYEGQVPFSLRRPADDGNGPCMVLKVQEADAEGNVRVEAYPDYNTVFLPKNVQYGMPLYKYSEKENSAPDDVNYFEPVEPYRER